MVVVIIVVVVVVVEVVIYLFNLIINVPSTIFHLYWDGYSLVEPVLSLDTLVLLKDHNVVTPLRLKSVASRSRGQHSTTEPMRSRVVI